MIAPDGVTLTPTRDDDIVDAWIHEAWCEESGPCPACVAEMLADAARPRLALPEGEADSWRRYANRCRVVGLWPAREAEILAELVELVWRNDGRTCGFWPDWPYTPNTLLWEGPPGSGWARVRVSIEVLDGVL